MPTKIDIKKALPEIGKMKRGELKRTNLTLSKAKVEAFAALCAPASVSEALEYLMECAIRGTKKGK